MPGKFTDALRAFYPARPRRLPEKEHLRVMSRARMEKAGGLHALYLSGTPYEMGYQHGVLARELIRQFRAEAYAYVETLVPIPRFLARPALFYYASAYWETIPADLREEMKGIADGAGAHPVEVLVATAIWEMLITSGCSEFAAISPYTPDGSIIHGYNYDLMQPEHAIIQPYLAAIFYRPSEGLPFMTVNTVGSVGANAGLNDAGISVAWDDTHLNTNELFKDIKGKAVPFIITLRKILQNARSIDEAVDIALKGLPRPFGDIIIIGSAAENSAIALETAGTLHARRPMVGGAVWSTNCFRSEELARYDKRGNWRECPKEEEWQRFPRFTAYTELFEKHHGKLDATAAASFLRDPYPREAEGFLHPNISPRATICRDITSFSMIMKAREKRVWVSDIQVPGCQGNFYAFDFAGQRRLPELDIPATGYHHALKCAELFQSGDYVKSRLFLDQAIAVDGETLPLLLMRAALEAMGGNEEAARGTLAGVVARWGETIPGKLAECWLNPGRKDEVAAVPFPSAIKPLLWFKAGEQWSERVVANSTTGS